MHHPLLLPPLPPPPPPLLLLLLLLLRCPPEVAIGADHVPRRPRQPLHQVVVQLLHGDNNKQQQTAVTQTVGVLALCCQR
jgi:hypothetical protein